MKPDMVKIMQIMISLLEEQEAKKDRASLNKLRSAFEDERKRIKKLYMDPYNRFEKQVKEVIALIDEPIRLIDAQIKEVEENKKLQKRKDIERGQVLGEYENYTEFYRTEEYIGKLYGIVVNKVGESVDERLASAEQTIAQTNIDMQMAIAELTMVIASTQGGGANV